MVAPAFVSFAPGSMLGKYELLAQIGRGGMAKVMLARQRGPSGFEKLVVLKALLPCYADDPDVVNMLLDEARLTARIAHPNVVQTYELGEAEGIRYIAMEYLSGESLFFILRRCQRSALSLPPLLAARIVAQAAEGLHAAHEAEDERGRKLYLIHRDVSPENIVVLYNGKVKVVDFGIAKSRRRITKTQVGIIKGKYSYMAPEHIQDGPIDRRSDVFALGVVLWEALTQQRLFNTPDIMSTLKLILREPRTPPSRIRPTIPRGLDEVVLTALQPDPRCRYQSAAAFERAIEDVIWPYRCGPSELREFMFGAFPDRVTQRRRMLSGADALSESQRQILTHRDPPRAADTGAMTVVTPSRPKSTRSTRSTRKGMAVGFGLALVVAFVVASMIALSGTSLATTPPPSAALVP